MKPTIYLLSLLLCILGAMPVNADDLTGPQKAFQTNIMQFLREEGFSPSIDDDNDIVFKKEGTEHWIKISGGSPFYVELHRSGFTIDDTERNVLLEAVNEGNKRARCAKAMVLNSVVSLAVETFCHAAEDFRYMFYKSMDELSSISNIISDYYDEHSSDSNSSSYSSSYSSSTAPFTVNSISVANEDKEGNTITDFGETIYSSQSRYLTPKAYINTTTPGSYEIYVKLYTPSGTLATGSSSPSGYSYKNTIKLTSGSRSYEFSGWGSNNPGHWSAGNYRFELYYNNKLLAQKTFTVY